MAEWFAFFLIDNPPVDTNFLIDQNFGSKWF